MTTLAISLPQNLPAIPWRPLGDRLRSGWIWIGMIVLAHGCHGPDTPDTDHELFANRQRVTLAVSVVPTDSIEPIDGPECGNP